MNLRKKLEMAEKSNQKTTLKCPREECGYIWNYSGEMPMATCPSCTYKLRVDTNKVKEESDDGED